MNHDNALDYLVSKLDEETAIVVAHLIQGKSDEAEYKRLCGKLQGLELARNYIKDLAKRLEAADE
jgi:hypothetical protein